MLDTGYAIETPEGVDISLLPVGPLPRILAYTIDLFIRWGIMIVLGMVLAYFGSFGAGMMSILYFFLEWFYPLFFEVLNHGMTPGKKYFGIHVVHEDGTPVSWNSSLIRNLLRAVDFLPFAYCTGLISMAIDRNFRRLGDLAAGTIVVYSHESRNAPMTSDIGVCPIPVSLNGDERQIIIDFSERRSRLSEQRQQELADILTPMTNGEGEKGVNTLAKMANGLKGVE